jgi:glycosyltransferase involved in cell wall biosynthesis
MSDAPVISVIIPTRALAERAALVRRAIDSVLAQEDVRAVPIVVVNGHEPVPSLVASLRADRRLRTTTLAAAHLPAAILAGREMVDTPYFAELDDDDQYLPGALALRVRTLAERPECDVVVTNGIARDSRGDALLVDDTAAVHRDPLRALLVRNWLLPGSWLCHTGRVSREIFADMPPFRECTFLALRFAIACRMIFVDTPTLIHHLGTPRAESRSREYTLGSMAATRRLLALDLPPDVQAAFRAGLVGDCLDIATLHRREGRAALAWTWYLRACLQPGGLAGTARQAGKWLRRSSA